MIFWHPLVNYLILWPKLQFLIFYLQLLVFLSCAFFSFLNNIFCLFFRFFIIFDSVFWKFYWRFLWKYVQFSLQYSNVIKIILPIRLLSKPVIYIIYGAAGGNTFDLIFKFRKKSNDSCNNYLIFSFLFDTIIARIPLWAVGPKQKNNV